MNKSFSKIRHIQESNQRLEKTLTKESPMDNQNPRFGYGSKEIDALRGGLGQDEDVYLSDNSDRLRGDVVKKKQYVVNMLRKALDNQDWEMVNNAIGYISARM